MKLARIIPLLAILFFSISLVSASHDYHYLDHVDRDSYKSYIGYDKIYLNPDRYPTYDYRHGYTYRVTHEYKVDKIKEHYRRTNHYEDLYDYDYTHSYHKYEKDYGHHNDHYYGYTPDSYYFKYNPTTDTYTKRDCYYHPPRGKLFYRQC